MSKDSVLEDLAYARALAEEGRQAPLLGGRYLVFWGSLNAAAFIAHWSALSGYLDALGEASFALVWGGYGVLAGIGMGVLGAQMKDKPGVSAIGVRAERAVWGGAQLALLAIVAGSISRLVLTNDTMAVNAILGAAFAIYAMAMFTVAALAQQSWMQRFAWLSGGVALALCLFANEPWAYLLAALASLIVLVWPGVILLRNEPRAIV